MRADVVVVGGGLAGSAAAWAVSRRGRGVVLLEAFEAGHGNGSSHGSARIFRRAYPDPLYVRLTGEAGKLWGQLEEEAGEELIEVTGGLDYGPSPEPEKMYEQLRAQQVLAELLTPGQAAERWPGLTFRDGDAVMYHPDAGVIDAERAMAAMRRLAAANGADVRYGTPVTSIGADGTVRTRDETFEAETVIVAAGPWVEPLVGEHVPLPPLVVTQTQAFHFPVVGAARALQAGEVGDSQAGDEGAAGATRPWPTFIYHGDDVPYYGLPSGADMPGAVKVGVHGHGTITTADGRDGVVNPVVREEVRQFVMSTCPGLSDEPAGEVTCMYTTTANEDFVLDRRGPFVVVSACSGHGAKFAPLIGEIAADLAAGEPQRERRFGLEMN
jgi:monomeric sarcosine oxidase